MRVSRALNSPQLVRPKTAEKVMQAVADYLLKKGYRRPGLLWTADRRAGQRKQGLCDALSRHGIGLVHRWMSRFLPLWHWGVAGWHSYWLNARLMSSSVAPIR